MEKFSAWVSGVVLGVVLGIVAMASNAMASHEFMVPGAVVVVSGWCDSSEAVYEYFLTESRLHAKHAGPSQEGVDLSNEWFADPYKHGCVYTPILGVPPVQFMVEEYLPDTPVLYDDEVNGKVVLNVYGILDGYGNKMFTWIMHRE